MVDALGHRYQDDPITLHRVKYNNLIPMDVRHKGAHKGILWRTRLAQKSGLGLGLGG